jgi:hypothetical protein
VAVEMAEAEAEVEATMMMAQLISQIFLLVPLI